VILALETEIEAIKEQIALNKVSSSPEKKADARLRKKLCLKRKLRTAYYIGLALILTGKKASGIMRLVLLDSPPARKPRLLSEDNVFDRMNISNRYETLTFSNLTYTSISPPLLE